MSVYSRSFDPPIETSLFSVALEKAHPFRAAEPAHVIGKLTLVV